LTTMHRPHACQVPTPKKVYRATAVPKSNKVGFKPTFRVKPAGGETADISTDAGPGPAASEGAKPFLTRRSRSLKVIHRPKEIDDAAAASATASEKPARVAHKRLKLRKRAPGEQKPTKAAVPARRAESNYCDTEWVAKQERSFTRWINFVLSDEAAGRAIVWSEGQMARVLRSASLAEVSESAPTCCLLLVTCCHHCYHHHHHHHQYTHTHTHTHTHIHTLTTPLCFRPNPCVVGASACRPRDRRWAHRHPRRPQRAWRRWTPRWPSRPAHVVLGRLAPRCSFSHPRPRRCNHRRLQGTDGHHCRVTIFISIHILVHAHACILITQQQQQQRQSQRHFAAADS
jgi:hypothetical protein